MGSKEWREAVAALSTKAGPAIADLENFMQGEEFAAARALLVATNREVVFSQLLGRDASSTICYLGVNGLEQRLALKPENFWPIRPDAAIMAAMNCGVHPLQPKEFVPYLRSELDMIAAEALNKT